jgi:hypothetical protein
MSEAVIPATYVNRRLPSRAMTVCVNDAGDESRYSSRVLNTDELLARLEERGIRNVDIARALGLPDSRVPEIRRKERALKLDEAVKLVRVFELEQDRSASPLPAAVLRLVVQYVAQQLGCPPERVQAKQAELTEDLRAFSEFVADPKVRRSIEMSEGFLRAMAFRRPAPGSEAAQGSDHQKSH